MLTITYLDSQADWQGEITAQPCQLLHHLFIFSKILPLTTAVR